MKNVPAKGAAGRRKSRASMDDAAHGVLVTVIDLGLARMDAHDASGHRVHWTPFDEETFEGEGDYQFDVYRMMRQHNGDAWEDYRPLTNVMVRTLCLCSYAQFAHVYPIRSGCTTWRSNC